MTLYAGDTIKTGGNSKTQITFFEGSTVELEANTEIMVAALAISETGSTNIELTQLLGKTISRVNKLTDPASNFNIETPSAIAAVRGSVMTVTVATSGVTVVTNEEGDIRVIVGETEYPISEGMQRTIAPGEVPSAETPIVPPGGYPPPQQARLEVTMQAPPTAHAGEVITYIYSLYNTGDLSFSSISASNDVAGAAVYQSGDTNSNELLDPYEMWALTSTYSVHSENYPQIEAHGTISATTPTGVTLSSMETATTAVAAVVITSPLTGATVNIREQVISGNVIDPAFFSGMITLNGGQPTSINIIEGTFSENVTLADGSNTITVTVMDEGENTSSHTITVTLIPYTVRIELTWSTGNNTDLDLHFIRPGGTFNDPDNPIEPPDPIGDCFFAIPNPNWGLPGAIVDNPSHSLDDFNGYGPETITLMAPYEAGIYSVMVHYYSGAVGTTATIKIYIHEILVATFNRGMSAGELWDCADIDWPSGIVTEIIGPV